MNILEIIALISTILCVELSTKQHIMAWPLGICSAITLTILYLETGMYANMVLQCVFFIQCIIGWYNWGIKEDIKVTSIDIFYPVIGALLLGYVYAKINLSINPNIIWYYAYLDGISTTIALLGNWCLTRKVIQAWPLFMTYNVIIGILLLSQGIYVIAALNACLFFISLSGFITWRKDLRKV